MALHRGMMSLLAALAVVALLYSVVELPRERRLRRDNERLRAQVDILDRRADQAIAVMEEMAERDNNFYRVMMGSEPMGNAARYAGLERQRNYDRLDSMADHRLVQGLSLKLDRLDQMIFSQSSSFDYLAGETRRQQQRISHIPAIQPVPERFLRAMASGYGVRHDPIYGTTKFHEGMDFSAPIGTPVYATADGRVATASWQGLYGNLIEIDHGFNYLTRYAHLSRIEVQPGQEVHRGDLIGRVGNTGKSTGPHLHYEVLHRGRPVNPINYFNRNMTSEEYDKLMLRMRETNFEKL